ncbi:MAG: glycosyltransferase family 4 protein [Bacillota bacterium]|nr:glycosyltransferase family 4 protein [Bacillota bacterium]
MKNILVVPGFVADTYSQIEESFIELSADKDPNIKFIWLVPEISSKYNRYAKVRSENKLDEPLYVKYLRKNRVEFVVGNIDKYNMIANILLFRRVFKKYNISAVYTHFGFERYYASFFAKLFGKKSVLNEHWHSLGTKFTAIKRIFYIFAIDYFISVSGFISSTLPKGKQVITIKNSLSFIESAAPDRDVKEALKKKLRLDNNKTLILMVASFTDIKRHDLAVEICKKVIAQRNDVMFVFLGQGELQEQISAVVESEGLAGHIMMPGHVNNVDDYYQVADICMLTSIGEAFGYTILEAFRHCLPFVAYNSGGPSEIIKDGITGYLIEPENTDEFTTKLINLIKNEDLRRCIGCKAHEDLKNEFSRQRWIIDIKKAFYKILDI